MVPILHGHLQCEAFLRGKWRFLDVDENKFYYDAENDELVGGDDVAYDHDLAERDRGRKARYGRDDDGGAPKHISGHTMDITLRPFETIVLRWDNIGKWAGDGVDAKQAPPFFGNSRIEYRPALASDDQRWVQTTNFRRTTQGLRPVDASLRSEVILQQSSPWVIAGASLNVSFGVQQQQQHHHHHHQQQQQQHHHHHHHQQQQHQQRQCAVDVVLQTGKWTSAWTGACSGSFIVDLDSHLGVHSAPAKYDYSVRVSMLAQQQQQQQQQQQAAAPILLSGLALVTHVMASPFSLPGLSLGNNTFEYSDNSPAGAPRRLVVAQKWLESAAGAVAKLAPPKRPTAPEDGSVVSSTSVSFEWPAQVGASLYHLLVSRRSDMRLPYRTQFDVATLTSPSLSRAHIGLFSPGARYYWRVRLREAQGGLWGDWSPTWSFTWAGPGVPTGLALTTSGCKNATLSWSPSARAAAQPAVAFEVYASNQTGFTPLAANSSLVATVMAHATAASAAGSSIDGLPSLHFAPLAAKYLRVVAVDAKGVRSGASDYVEVPRPCIYSCDVTAAMLGRRYAYQLEPALSEGDLQFRGLLGQWKGFYEREGAVFTLLEGPSWLSLDGKTGMLSGTPAKLGNATVRVLTNVTYPYDRSDGVWSKQKPSFIKSCAHTFTVRVQAMVQAGRPP